MAGMDPAALLAAARQRHGLDQRSLARRARTSQAQISRIERGEISPSFATLQRLLACMGEELRLAAAPMPHGNQPTDELRADFQATSAPDRVGQAAELSSSLTAIASAGFRRR